MGWLDFLNPVGDIFKDVGNGIANGVTDIFHTGVGILQQSQNNLTSVINHAIDIPINTINTIGNTANKVIDTAGNLAEKGLDILGSPITLLLLGGGALVVLMIVMKSK